MAEAAPVAEAAATRLLELPANLVAAAKAAATAVALASSVALAAAFLLARLWAIASDVPRLTAIEAVATLAASSEAAAIALASTVALAAAAPALATSASCHIDRLELAAAVVGGLVVLHSVALEESATIHLGAMHEEVGAAIILDDEAKSLLVVEELHGAGLGHGAVGVRGKTCETG